MGGGVIISTLSSLANSRIGYVAYAALRCAQFANVVSVDHVEMIVVVEATGPVLGLRWDRLQVWEGSAAHDAWSRVDEYVAFCSYDVLGLKGTYIDKNQPQSRQRSEPPKYG